MMTRIAARDGHEMDACLERPAGSPRGGLVIAQEMYGITESGLAKVIQISYRLARLLSFFTVGSDECRAWTIKQNSTAVDAAGAIHSDLARGFIRAEVIHWDTLLEARTYAEARKRGQLRSEGKSYLVQDGDVLNILFNV